MRKVSGWIDTVSKLKLAVLISGRGSNLQALIDACADPAFPAEIAVVVSNNPDAAGLARAAEAGIPAMICDHRYFQGDKAAFEDSLATIIEQHGTELVCLAGFMRILGPTFLNRLRDRVINIHPSLLPAYKGLDTHERVLAAGESVHGCSVHVVTAGMDEGAVIAQKHVPVLSDDTADALAERVLAQEHLLYPAVVADIAIGALVIRQGRIERTTPIRHHGDADIESFPIPEDITGVSLPVSAPVTSLSRVTRAQRANAAAVMRGTLAGGLLLALALALLAAFSL